MPNDSKSVNDWSSAYLAVCPGSTSRTGWRGLRNSGGALWATVTCSCWASFCTSSSPVTHSDNPCYMHRLPLSYIYMPWQLLRWQTLIHTVPVHVTCSAKPLLHTWMTPVTCKDYCCDIQLHFCYIRSAPAMLGLCWTVAIRYTQWTLLYTCQWHWQTLAKQSITTHFSKGSGGANIQVCIIIILFTTITIRDAPSCQVLKSAFYRLVSGTEPSHFVF